MIQLRCPRCGTAVSFGAKDERAVCPGCQYSVQVQGREIPREPHKDEAITNAMWIIAGIVVFSFGIPIASGFLSEGRPKMCAVKSTPVAAQIYEEEQFLGETPLDIPRAKGARELRIEARGFQSATLTLPGAAEASECTLTATLSPKP